MYISSWSGMELCVWEITVHAGPPKMVGILHDLATAGWAECITVVYGHQGGLVVARAILAGTGTGAGTNPDCPATFVVARSCCRMRVCCHAGPGMIAAPAVNDPGDIGLDVGKGEHHTVAVDRAGPGR